MIQVPMGRGFCIWEQHCVGCLAICERSSPLMLTEEATVQGKYINDEAVLLEAAKNAGVRDPEKVVRTPDVAKAEVRLTPF
jgi:hypothetical protein